MVAVHRSRERDALLATAARAVGAAVEELPARIEALRTQLAEARRAATQAAVTGTADVRALLADALQVGPARLVVHRMDGAPAEAAKNLVDDLVARGEGVVALAASVDGDGKILLCAKADEVLAKQGAHAGNLVREVASACGGGGGGKPTFAQAGARDASKLDEALAKAAAIVAQQLGESPPPSS
jgi:alanyl-tRNA synthetase